MARHNPLEVMSCALASIGVSLTAMFIGNFLAVSDVSGNLNPALFAHEHEYSYSCGKLGHQSCVYKQF